MSVEDEEAEKPEGWLDDEPAEIADPGIMLTLTLGRALWATSVSFVALPSHSSTKNLNPFCIHTVILPDATFHIPAELFATGICKFIFHQHCANTFHESSQDCVVGLQRLRSQTIGTMRRMVSGRRPPSPTRLAQLDLAAVSGSGQSSQTLPTRASGVPP